MTKEYTKVTNGVTGVIIADSTDENVIVKCFNYQIYYNSKNVVFLTLQQQKTVFEIANKIKEKTALKAIVKDVDDCKSLLIQIEQYEKELHILKLLQGKKNIVQLVGDGIERNGILLGIKMEKMETDLFNWLRVQRFNKVKYLAEDLILHLTGQLLDAIFVTHEMFIAHLDVKPANLLINEKNQLKLCDFGNAMDVIPEGFNHVTLNYRPPELFEKREYKSFDEVMKADIWSAGCVIYELCFLEVAKGLLPYRYDRNEFLMIIGMLKSIDQPPLIKHLVTKMVCNLENRADIHFLFDLFNAKFNNRLFEFT